MDDKFDLELNTPIINIDLKSPEITIELPGGARGLQGIQGPKGDTGATPDFEIGTVVSGNTSSATITGTPENPILNLELEKGKSGVWVGEYEPTDPDYDVWINPIGTPGTIPTKTSDLINDSGFVSIEEIGFTEHLTNKVFIDENNVRHSVYSKILDLTEDNTQSYTIDGYTGTGIEHGITNFDKLINFKTFLYSYSNSGYVSAFDPGDFSIKGPYLFTYLNFNDGFTTRVILEYTKSS